MTSIIPSSLEDWLAFQTRAHPRAIDLSLERLSQVLGRLQWRPPAVPVITIAGTNGKGSVAATCSAVLAAAGCRVGSFTSPHLRDYRERIRVHGKPVSADLLLWAFQRIEAARGETGLTFFEYNTLAALLIFDAAQLDAWVLEVGMGGRLDAVNVVDPDVAVVVSIGFDHEEYLGTSLESIGREKAGIFRPSRPAILGSRTLPPVIENTALALGAHLERLGKEFDFDRTGATWHFRGTRWDLPGLPPPVLPGDVQFDNAATAIAAIEALGSRVTVSAAAVAAGLRSVRLAGRFQIISARAPGLPTWILDVGHNPAAASVLASNLRALPVGGRTLAVCGILGDKDAASIIDELAECIDAWWFVTTEGERGRSGASLAQLSGGRVRRPAVDGGSVASGCAAALAAARGDDRIVIFGSFHTVGPALQWLEARGILPPDECGEYTDGPRGT